MFSFVFYRYLYARYSRLRSLIYLSLISTLIFIGFQTEYEFISGFIALWLIYKVYREIITNQKIERYAKEHIKTDPVLDLYEVLLTFENGWVPNWLGHMQRTPGETLSKRKGVCWDISNLLYTLYDSAGISSKFVWVFIDQDGDEVSHICLQVSYRGKEILVDPIYKTWDAKHKSFELCHSLNLPVL